MGLFDNYYDPSTYQGNSGGLIDRLLAQLGTQSQYQPSQGLPAVPMNAQASMPAAQPQNDPVAIGNYQMPRIGSGFADATTQAPVPQTMPQQPPIAQPPAFLQPQQSQGGFGSAMRGALANMQAGPLGMIGGAIAGGMGMGQGTQIEQQRRALQQKYEALIPILGPQKAQLAVLGGAETEKQLLQDALGKDKFSVVKTGQDGLGREQYEVFNANTGAHTPIRPQAATDGGGGLGNTDLTGKEYLATLPKEQANTVQMMVEGKIAPPSSFALSKPYWQSMIAAAKNYDPTFDATQWSARVAGAKDFSAGKSAEMVRSANQTLHHVGQLLTSMDDLNNGSYPFKNRIGNAISEATGSGAPGAFRTNAHAVAEELSKVFKGSNLSDAEIRAWEQNLNENMSPDQQRAQIAKLRDLLKGSLDALEEKRVNSIGPIAAEKQGPLIKDEGQKVLERIDSWLKPKASGEQKTKSGISWSIQ